ncbi:MAG: response regulator [Spirochaetes bacterium]|nr:response regulator [Spirochaetota bacterium]
MGKSKKNKIPMKKTVLVIDDEQVTCEMLGAILKEINFNVITAGKGKEGIKKAKGEYLDVAIIDVKLPGINGVETYKILQKAHPEMKGIMITAFYEKKIIKKALDYGAITCLYKPFDVDELISLIKEIVSEKR